MAAKVTKNTIDTVMQTIGQVNRHSANVYLMGGAMLVHSGVRAGATADVDIYVEGDATTGILEVKKQRICDIEETNPGLFLPWPTGWQSRCLGITTIHKVSFFYIDPYIVALTKFTRFEPKDQSDIRLLIDKGWVTTERLRSIYENDIRPHIGSGQYGRKVAKYYETYFNSIVP